MLTEVLAYLKNWFCKSKYYGEFTVKDGNIGVFDNGVEFVDNYLKDGQYFRIIGSTLNDGVYQYPAKELQDEVFDGAVWGLAIPPAVIELAEEIDGWHKKFGEISVSPYSSESFGGYSYSKSTTEASWQTQFASRLKPWRKI